MKSIARAAFVACTLWAAAAFANEALLEAVKSNDAPRALAAIDQGADAGSAEANGTTALHWAVFHGELELVERLIAAGADVSRANAFGSTPMSEAAVLGRADIIAALLDAGADVESPNADGQTALMVVARSSNVAAASLLMQRGADVQAREQWRGQTALMWAAARSQPEMVALLLRHGADVDARSKVNDWERQVSAEPRAQWRPAGGWTALMYAARQGCVECARLLVEAGADMDLADGEGVTPLLVAIMNLHFDLAKLLVERGANPGKWDWRGRTPLYVAVDMSTLPRGGWPDRPSADATTALELIELLLEHGANPNARLKLNPMWRYIPDDRGRDVLLSIGTTPLLRAAKAFDAGAIRLLLRYGADPDLGIEGGISRRQIRDITPLMAAAGLGSRPTDTRGRYDTPDVEDRSIEALRLLLEGGADINAVDSHGRTAMHGAAFWGWTRVVRFLADNGGDALAADADGMTPHDAAFGRMREGLLVGTPTVKEETAALLAQLMAEAQRQDAR